ncbi:hypothetical protein EYF80_023851 [Liparis tanakae]|uniref:Uncharacterized protein n=1 Tax=Liparis tanakae TaxID=230148 RepID=A0A4Z2HJS8_9TELE|nr:hypothetical protein EYF80_023851 [Liparis tanakae]
MGRTQPREEGIYSPGRCKLHVGVEKSRHFGCGHLPALNPGSDQTLPLLVPDDLHKAGDDFFEQVSRRVIDSRVDRAQDRRQSLVDEDEDEGDLGEVSWVAGLPAPAQRHNRPNNP